MPAVIGIARSRSRGGAMDDDQYGVPGMVGVETPHALRHWFVTALRGLRAAGVDSLVIKELVGPQSLATTAIYIDVPLTQRTNAGLLPELGAQRLVAGRE